MPRSSRSNPLALAVLACLFERPMHPYEMAQVLRSRGKHESIKLNYGSLYSVVEGLERKGFVTAQSVTRTGKRPERTVYSLSESGHRELTDWLTDLVAEPSKQYLDFEAALSLLPALAPEDAVAALRQRHQTLAFRAHSQRATIEAMAKAGLPRLFGLETEYELAVIEAEADFVQALLDDLEAGTLEGLGPWTAWHRDGGEPPELTPRDPRRPEEG